MDEKNDTVRNGGGCLWTRHPQPMHLPRGISNRSASARIRQLRKGDRMAGAMTEEMKCGQQVGLPSRVLAYDGWNQAAAEETCQTLRAVASEGEANDAVVKVCVIW